MKRSMDNCRSMHRRRTILIASLGAGALLAACGGGGSGGGGAGSKVGVNGTYLFVSVPNYYFGTRDVGTVSTETIEIQNRGGDAYPLKSIAIRGKDADEFSLPFYDEIVLQPAQAIRVPLSFEPLDGGRKFASLDIDYDTIQLVDESVNLQEQAYYEASDLAKDGQFRAARRSYGAYLESDPVTVNRRRAAIRVPVVKEAEFYGEGVDSQLYVEALDARDRGTPEEAIIALDSLLLTHSDGFLGDDARYLKAYIALMDLDDPTTALREFQELARAYPDTTYRDTALYGEAIAQERLGNDRLALSIYEDLLARHTGIDALGIQLPKDDLVSRLWFERASRAIEALAAA